MPYDVQTVVVGAGVIGLAVARALAIAGHDVLILEQNSIFGSETSARHSEVIHAGIYYPKNSLKAKLCTHGKALLYDYCNQYAIAHKRLGKIIVATSDEQVAELLGIQHRAQENGVDDLQLLQRDDISSLEPAIKAKAGILSPSTGIIDSHGFMLSLLGQAENHGAMIAYNSKVVALAAVRDSIVVSVGADTTERGRGSVGGEAAERGDVPERSNGSMEIRCQNLVNAAGHGACALVKRVTLIPSKLVPSARYAKGNYFRLQGKTPVSRLIYPVPEPGGLGVHVTVDLAGQCRFGPDVQWQDSINYDVDATRADNFYHAIRRYWPGLQNGALLPDYAGVRPKIELNAKPYTDFLVQDSSAHGIDGLVNLFGIESPGLTSSLALAEYVVQRIL